jgi:hypothetical protein
MYEHRGSASAPIVLSDDDDDNARVSAGARTPWSRERLQYRARERGVREVTSPSLHSPVEHASTTLEARMSDHALPLKPSLEARLQGASVR